MKTIEAVPNLEENERELFIDNLLVRVHFIIVMMRWTDLTSWESEFPLNYMLSMHFSGEIVVLESGQIVLFWWVVVTGLPWGPPGD